MLRSLLTSGLSLSLLLNLLCADDNHLPPPPSSPGPEAVATFECLSLSWAPPGGAVDNACTVRYRVEGKGEWREALPLWFDARNGEYRGSIVRLRPGTAYDVSLSLKKGGQTTTLRKQTWSERYPVARTVTLPPGISTESLVITEGGTPEGYVVYTAPQGGAIDVAGAADDCVVVQVPYVILRGLTLRGARRNGIRLEQGGLRDVVVERCDISGWGRIASDGWGENLDAAVYANTPGTTRLVVQRCRLHDPRSNANDWSQPRTITREKKQAHPNGPQAIYLYNTGGNNVLRYNEIFADESHRFNDGMGGNQNFSFEGFPGRDSDIYANIVRNVADDALEIEGGGRNVRVWGNYLDHTATGIASAAVSIGPLYIFRNVYAVSRWNAPAENKASKPGIFGKIADSRGYGSGRRYFFHNTLLQPPLPGGGSEGAGSGVGDSAGPMTATVSRNNIWHVTGWSVSDRRESPDNDFDYDLFSGEMRLPAGQEANGVHGVPLYAPENGPDSFSNSGGPIRPSGRYALAQESPGFKAGEPISGFNDGFAGKAPDMGAHETGTPPMEFGVCAYETGASLKIALIGDSTVCDYPEESPQRGWGQLLSEFLPPCVTILNEAKGGLSTKTYPSKQWEKILAIRPDLVLIQFGHNDSHASDRPESTKPEGDYTENLRRYVTEARGAGITPILVTPMHRRVFDAKGVLSRELLPYVTAMKKVADALQVPLIDLYEASDTLFQTLGDEGSASLTLPGDRTHFTAEGARLMASQVAQRLGIVTSHPIGFTKSSQ